MNLEFFALKTESPISTKFKNEVSTQVAPYESSKISPLFLILITTFVESLSEKVKSDRVPLISFNLYSVIYQLFDCSSVDL